MLSWFRRKSPAVVPTFNERARAFWSWFEAVAPRFYAAIESGKCPELAGEVSAKVDEHLPSFAYVFGPGPERKGHSFTLSGEGVLHRQLLTQQWCALAPAISGWTFHASRQAGPIAGQTIRIGETTFDPREIWVTPLVNQEAQKIDLTLWHPACEQLGRNGFLPIVFLFLDEALGEFGTEQWIGSIELGQGRLAESFPLAELADHVSATAQQEGWKKYPPGEATSLYSFEEPLGNFPRGDLRTQITRVPPLQLNYLESKGQLADPLAGTGADYLYVSIGIEYFPAGQQSRVRGEIEDALEAALEAESSGTLIGGGFGTERGYVDLLIFDGARSLEIVRNTLRAFSLPAGSMLEYFAREKRGQRIAL